jgi:hypothetical protein
MYNIYSLRGSRCVWRSKTAQPPGSAEGTDSDSHSEMQFNRATEPQSGRLPVATVTEPLACCLAWLGGVTGKMPWCGGGSSYSRWAAGPQAGSASAGRCVESPSRCGANLATVQVGSAGQLDSWLSGLLGSLRLSQCRGCSTPTCTALAAAAERHPALSGPFFQLELMSRYNWLVVSTYVQLIQPKLDSGHWLLWHVHDPFNTGCQCIWLVSF